MCFMGIYCVFYGDILCILWALNDRNTWALYGIVICFLYVGTMWTAFGSSMRMQWEDYVGVVWWYYLDTEWHNSCLALNWVGTLWQQYVVTTCENYMAVIFTNIYTVYKCYFQYRSSVHILSYLVDTASNVVCNIGKFCTKYAWLQCIL